MELAIAVGVGVVGDVLVDEIAKCVKQPDTLKRPDFVRLITHRREYARTRAKAQVRIVLRIQVICMPDSIGETPLPRYKHLHFAQDVSGLKNRAKNPKTRRANLGVLSVSAVILLSLQSR